MPLALKNYNYKTLYSPLGFCVSAQSNGVRDKRYIKDETYKKPLLTRQHFRYDF